MDCIEGLKLLEKDSVDITITSPPYNLGEKIFRRRNINKVGYADNLEEEEYFNFINGVIKELIRVTKTYVFFNIQPVSGNKKTIFRIIGKYADNLKEIIIWHKKRSAPPRNSSVLSHNYEFILIFEKNFPEKRSYIFDFGNQGKLKTCWLGEINDLFYKESFNVDGHCAIFPIWLPRKIIKNFSKIGDIVLDPFMGSGTTALVCKQQQRNFIGFEIDNRFIDISKKRLSQKNMFEIAEKRDSLNSYMEVSGNSSHN